MNGSTPLTISGTQSDLPADTLAWPEMFRDVCDAFAQAWQRRPQACSESDYLFAGQPVRLRVAGRVLAEYGHTAFAHLTTKEAQLRQPLLFIDWWDEIETCVPNPFPSLPGALRSGRPVDGGTFAVSSDERYVAYWTPGTATWMDRAAQHIVGWRASAAHLTLAERSKPLPLLLPQWYSDRGIEMVHAGLVSRDGHGVLIAGDSGAGKSTTALACINAGFDYLGDDAVGIRRVGEREFAGYSLYASTRLDPDHLRHFPPFGTHAIPARPPDETKSLIFVHHAYPGRLMCVTALRAIALPCIVDAADTRVRRASKREALLTLIPSSIFGRVPSPGARGIELLARLVDLLPAYWLELGSDRLRIADGVESLLGEGQQA